MKTTDPEKQRIRNELAAEIRDSRQWLKTATNAKSSETRLAIMNLFKGEIDAFRMAARIVGK